MAKTSTAKNVKSKTSTKQSKALNKKKGTKVSKKDKKDKEDTDNRRSFRAIYKTLAGEVVRSGRYCGKKPKQAGCKALTAILTSYFNETKKKYKKLIYFGVVETTRGSKHKHYWYSGERTKVDTVKVKIAGGKSITYRYNNVVKKASEEKCVDLLPEEDSKKTKKVKKTATKSKTGTKDKSKAKKEKDTKKSTKSKKAAPKSKKSTKPSASKKTKKPVKKGTK